MFAGHTFRSYCCCEFAILYYAQATRILFPRTLLQTSIYDMCIVSSIFVGALVNRIVSSTEPMDMRWFPWPYVTPTTICDRPASSSIPFVACLAQRGCSIQSSVNHLNRAIAPHPLNSPDLHHLTGNSDRIPSDDTVSRTPRVHWSKKKMPTESIEARTTFRPNIPARQQNSGQATSQVAWEWLEDSSPPPPRRFTPRFGF